MRSSSALPGGDYCNITAEAQRRRGPQRTPAARKSAGCGLARTCSIHLAARRLLPPEFSVLLCASAPLRFKLYEVDDPGNALHHHRRTHRAGVERAARLQQPRGLASHRRAVCDRRRRTRRPGRLRAALHSAGWCARARAADCPVGPGVSLHLLHPRGGRAARALCRYRAAQAGHGRTAYVLALAIDLPRTARARARARRSGRSRRLRRRLRRPETLPGTGGGAGPGKTASGTGAGRNRRRVPGCGRTRGAGGQGRLRAAAGAGGSAYRPQRDRRELPGHLHPPRAGPARPRPASRSASKRPGSCSTSGRKSREVKPGDRVAYAMLPPGSYVTHRNVPASQLVRIPASHQRRDGGGRACSRA